MVSHGVFARSGGGGVGWGEGVHAINWPRLQCKGSEEVKMFVRTSVVILAPQGLNHSYSHLCRDNPIFCLLFCSAGHAKKTKRTIFIEVTQLLLC